MNEKLFVLASQKKTTNHVLHLLLCIPTFGLWLIVWLLIAGSNSKHNSRLEKQMGQVLDYKMQGLSDTDTYKQIKNDELNSQVLQGRVIFVILVVVFLYFYLR
ncbi:hypothetical protein CXQ81_12605 [Pseudomonas sp. 09C 129]|uniref:hypothetical protein n=1 Tax=Pseudomonas sp. 09C 129 TaxID=2054915 RepID=UPI000C6EEFDE|nr:hypothetical protein [Pseudomonas sp. 09C 129]AUG01409.1 hypothetical protein CXQ81_12605 [Pseudomonas sp. 09C 129]